MSELDPKSLEAAYEAALTARFQAYPERLATWRSFTPEQKRRAREGDPSLDAQLRGAIAGYLEAEAKAGRWMMPRLAEPTMLNAVLTPKRSEIEGQIHAGTLDIRSGAAIMAAVHKHHAEAWRVMFDCFANSGDEVSPAAIEQTKSPNPDGER